MRRWGIVITLIYAVIVIVLLVPVFVWLGCDESPFSPDVTNELMHFYAKWALWVTVAFIVAAQALLLVLSVDTGWKRRRPRTHISITIVLVVLLFAVLAFAAIVSLHSASETGGFPAPEVFSWAAYPVVAILWAIWAAVFFLYLRRSSALVTRAASWLLNGSVLELLVAVPCHVIARRRGECCATFNTSLGIVTGLAIMLLSFGPGILLLYKKRIDAYSDRKSAATS